VIVLTHDHALDFLIVSAALKRDDLAQVGMIGSDTKRATFEHQFIREGGDKAQLSKTDLPDRPQDRRQAAGGRSPPRCSRDHCSACGLARQQGSASVLKHQLRRAPPGGDGGGIGVAGNDVGENRAIDHPQALNARAPAAGINHRLSPDPDPSGRWKRDDRPCRTGGGYRRS
jgi:hypothetical protein